MKSKLLRLRKWLKANSCEIESNNLLKIASKPNTLLLLIHPDCIGEQDVKYSEEYLKRLNQHTNLFNKVISILFYSADYRQAFPTAEREESRANAVKNIRDYLDNNSTTAYDTKGGRIVYNTVVGDYLINNENLTIYLGGGYQDLCLADHYLRFSEILGEIIEDNNHKIKFYKPLIFNRKFQWGVDEELIGWQEKNIPLRYVEYEKEQWKNTPATDEEDLKEEEDGI